MEIIGHRGDRVAAPQNTIESFRAAMEAGVDMIELDVQLTRDNRLIVFHDEDVDTITGGQARGPVSSYSFDEIRRLNVHDNFQGDVFYQIPTLEEVLDLVDSHAAIRGRRTRVNIELKGEDTVDPTAVVVESFLAAGWRPEDFLISSFSHERLGGFKRRIPAIDIAMPLNTRLWDEVGRLPDRAIAMARGLGAAAINPELAVVTRELVDAAHQAEPRLEVNVYTVNDDGDVTRMLGYGVNRILTDNPRLARQVIEAAANG